MCNLMVVLGFVFFLLLLVETYPMLPRLLTLSLFGALLASVHDILALVLPILLSLPTVTT